jgi:acyl-CoA synthetase (AMP-forming)/AMP-acid ligase II
VPSESLAALLFESAARVPDKTVFVSAKQAMSYAELAERAARFASGLRALGVKRGDRVLLVLDGVVEFLIAYYGALAAGAAVVPHNPDTRREILAHALNDSGARAVVLEGKHVNLLAAPSERLPALDHVISLDPAELPEAGRVTHHEFSALLAGAAEASPLAGAEDLACLVYTSGTTGKPKGVMLSHANVLANTRSITEYLELTASDNMAMVLPFYYVYGASVLNTHVAVGGTLTLVGSLTFPAALLKNIAKHTCTGFAGVPSTFARLVQLNLAAFDLSSLRYLTQAGGPMSAELTRKVRAALPSAKLYVMYGQTEAAARLSYVPPDALDRKLGSVGIAIPGVSLRVLDEAGQEAPPGKTGEVVARGANVMLGYWRDGEATLRVLRPEGLRTGDLGYFDEDGFLFLVGRQSELIKSGAHRIGPREIEETIERLPEVAECAVVGVPDELLGEAILAVIVLAPGATLSAEAVQRHVVEHLPRYKMPSEVRFVSELPRTATGKVQRRALAALAVPAAGASNDETGS